MLLVPSSVSCWLLLPLQPVAATAAAGSSTLPYQTLLPSRRLRYAAAASAKQHPQQQEQQQGRIVPAQSKQSHRRANLQGRGQGVGYKAAAGSSGKCAAKQLV